MWHVIGEQQMDIATGWRGQIFTFSTSSCSPVRGDQDQIKSRLCTTLLGSKLRQKVCWVQKYTEWFIQYHTHFTYKIRVNIMPANSYVIRDMYNFYPCFCGLLLDCTSRNLFSEVFGQYLEILLDSSPRIPLFVGQGLFYPI